MYTHKSNNSNEVLNKLEARLLHINEPQRLILLLMTYSSFNSFQGAEVVRDLVQYKNLWQCCVMDNFIDGLRLAIPLLKLRDLHPAVERRLSYPIYNVNCLYILTDKNIALIKMADKKHWNYDSCYTYSKIESGKLMGGRPALTEKNLRIVRFWWA